jgi:hypothetical protein
MLAAIQKQQQQQHQSKPNSSDIDDLFARRNANMRKISEQLPVLHRQMEKMLEQAKATRLRLMLQTNEALLLAGPSAHLKARAESIDQMLQELRNAASMLNSKAVTTDGDDPVADVPDASLPQHNEE